jgi:triosephosphate isomerase
MRTPLVAGNWKMNGSLAVNRELLKALRSAGKTKAAMAVCVPFPYLAQAQAELTGSAITWGAQDISAHELGAFTGEVSGPMIMEFGCSYAIVGHSERRTLHGETDEIAAAKYAAALKAGLTPIFCVGETLAEREANVTAEVVTRQLEAVLTLSGVASLSKAVIAYEPVWAIGTGLTASPSQAQEVHALIRARVARDDATVAAGVQILYGGSMKPGNAVELMAQTDIDGGLIGGAALVAADFLSIAAAA